MYNILKFKKYSTWYKNINKSLKIKFKDDYILFAGLLASTSPRFQIKRNYNTSLNIYNDYVKQGKKCFIFYAITNKTYFIKHYKLLPCHFNNIIRVLKNDNKQGLQLSGNKVNAFYNNIIGDYNYITLDIHMLRFFKHDKNSINKGDYKKYSQYLKSIKRNLKKHYNINLNNASLQAIIWEYIRNKQGFKISNFNKWI